HRAPSGAGYRFERRASERLPGGLGEADLLVPFHAEADAGRLAVLVQRGEVRQVDRHRLRLAAALAGLGLALVADRDVHALDHGLVGLGVDRLDLALLALVLAGKD